MDFRPGLQFRGPLKRWARKENEERAKLFWENAAKPALSGGSGDARTGWGGVGLLFSQSEGSEAPPASLCVCVCPSRANPRDSGEVSRRGTSPVGLAWVDAEGLQSGASLGASLAEGCLVLFPAAGLAPLPRLPCYLLLISLAFPLCLPN